MSYQILGDIARQTTVQPAPNSLKDAFKDALAAAQKVRREEQQAQLGVVIHDLLKRTETAKQTRLLQIRKKRQEINRLKNQLNEIDRAWAYAQDTENFIPLVVLLGGSVHRTQLGLTMEEFVQLSTIPQDWKPSK